MARYSEKQKAALDALMKDDVYRNAMKILADEGIGSLTMERLATDVGVSRGTLYNYFDDKDAVVDFVEERTFGPLLETIEQIAEDNLDPGAKLTRIAEIIFDAIYADRALVVALVPNKHSGANRECHLGRRATLMAAIERVIGEGTQLGTFRDIPAAPAAEIFGSTVGGLIDSMTLSGKFYRADDIVPTLMEIYLQGVRNTS